MPTNDRSSPRRPAQSPETDRTCPPRWTVAIGLVLDVVTAAIAGGASITLRRATPGPGRPASEEPRG